MVKKNLLEAKMKIFGDTQCTLAEALEISLSTLNCKLNGKSEFAQSEILKIKERYNLTDKEVIEIFFSPCVSETGT